MKRRLVVPCALILAGCRSKPLPHADGSDSAASPEAAISASGGTAPIDAGTVWHCRTRQDMLDVSDAGYPWSMHPPPREVAPGESAGWFCLGDARSFYERQIRNAEDGACSRPDGGSAEVCRLPDADLTFEHSRLMKIRLHRTNRQAKPSGRYYSSDWYLIPPYTYFTTPVDKLGEFLPAPLRRSVVRDPEFGEVTLLEFDGLTLELDKADGGSVLAGIIVKRKGDLR